jgi:hypothetical protein
MKKLILGVLVILFWMNGFSLSQPLNNFKPGSEPDGFGDIKWGTELSALWNMKFLKADPSFGGIDIYLRSEEAPRIGTAKPKNIEYLFWKGKFIGVRFIEDGVSEYKFLKEAVFEVYGKGNKPYIDQEYYVWDGESTLMALEFYPFGERVLFWMMCKSILNRMEWEEQEVEKQETNP